MKTAPVRGSLRDGARCLRRYPQIWIILAVFGAGYAVFKALLTLVCWFVLPEGIRPELAWATDWTSQPAADLLRETVSPVLESLAGLFNNAVPTFPLSAIAAVLFLANWRRSHTVLWNALRRKYGRWRFPAYGGILVCALAATLKPVMYALLPSIGTFFPGPQNFLLQVSSVVDWLSFLFEASLGMFIQVYLISLALTWIRGLGFTRQHLLEFALRRFSFVLKWTMVVLGVTTLLIHLPLILSSFLPAHLPTESVLWFIDAVAWSVLAVLMLVFCGMQITLTFHNDSLRQAFQYHFAFLRRFFVPLTWFILVAAVHLFLLALLDARLRAGLGAETLPGLSWSVLAQVIKALVVGWLICSWVCLYKSCESGHTRLEDWIRY